MDRFNSICSNPGCKRSENAIPLRGELCRIISHVLSDASVLPGNSSPLRNALVYLYSDPTLSHPFMQQEREPSASLVERLHGFGLEVDQARALEKWYRIYPELVVTLTCSLLAGLGDQTAFAIAYDL